MRYVNKRKREGSEMRNRGRKTLCALLCACLLPIAALADGNAVYFNQAAGREYSYNDYREPQESPAYEDTKVVRVISKSASIWQEPRTNSKKLGSASNGQEIDIIRAEDGGALEQNGFYRVSFNGKAGWINKDYCVYAPFEIVLMESNVPAYCAPDRASKKVGSLSKLTRHTVIGTYGDYYIVNLRQAAAFIPMDVAHYDSAFEAAYSQQHASAVTTREAALYAGPGRGYAKLQTLDEGEQITVYGTYENWYVMKNYNTNPETLMFIEKDAARVWSDWLPER